MSIYPMLGLLLGSAYIAWCTYSLVTGKGSITFTSSRILPSMAAFIAGKRGMSFFHLFTSFILQKWRILYVLRHFFGIGMLTLLLITFYYRMYHGHIVDLLWLPIAFMLTILFHELGHAISYARANVFIMHVRIGLPIAGRTSVLSSVTLLEKQGKACIGIAGSAMNLLAACMCILLLLLTTHAFLIYMMLTNLCFFANCFYPVTKDYKDITHHLS